MQGEFAVGSRLTEVYNESETAPVSPKATGCRLQIAVCVVFHISGNVGRSSERTADTVRKTTALGVLESICASLLRDINGVPGRCVGFARSSTLGCWWRAPLELALLPGLVWRWRSCPTLSIGIEIIHRGLPTTQRNSAAVFVD